MNRRVIIQESSSHVYLAADGSWTSDCQQARTFEHTYLALLEGMNHPGKSLQVVWCFRNPAMNMYLPVHPGDDATTCHCIECPLAQAAA
jgi:hypothetical protein